MEPEVMKWAGLVEDLLKAIAWPVIVLTAVLVFRRPMLGLIPRMAGVKWRDLEIKFAESLDEASRRADAANLPPAEEAVPPPVPPTSPAEYLTHLASTSPRTAIFESWMLVERAINAALARAGQPQARSFRAQLRALEQIPGIEQSLPGLLRDLRPLRNQAVHDAEFTPQESDAVRFIDVALRVVAALEQEVP